MSCPSLVHHHLYNQALPGRKERLGFKALLQTGRQSNLVIARPKRCARHQACRSELDRQTDTSQTLKDASFPSYTQTEARTSPGPAPQTTQMGNDPQPLEARPRKPDLRSRECLNLWLEHGPKTPGDVSRDWVPGRQPRRK